MEDNERLPDRLTDQCADAGWQPIETAPKGDVLLYWPSKMTGAHQQVRMPAMMRVGSVGDTPHRQPTHWMPLPAPPVEGA